MASQPNNAHGVSALGSDMLVMVQRDGSAGHVWRKDPLLLAGAESARNLADIVHHMASLHGRHPGLVDLAEGGEILGRIQHRIIRGFAAERDYLARLVVAVGPLPGTPGQALSQAAIVGQRHALETLAHSDRAGCASGAVAALLMDWASIRPVLDAAAVRFGIDPVATTLPDPAGLAATIEASPVIPALGRAIGFGLRQFLLQHRGLWDLLEARAHARRHA